MRTIAMGLMGILLLTIPGHAVDKWLINDGFESGGTAYYQMGFASDEIMASVFVPDAGDYPFRLKTLHTLVQDGGSGGTIGAFVLMIWEDSGSVTPGTLLHSESIQLTAADAYNEVDLRPYNIIINSGNVRIGYQHVLDPPPSFCRDADGNIQSHRNLIYGNIGMGWNWYWSENLGLQGDWIHRVEIQTNYAAPTATQGPPTATPTLPPPTDTPTMAPPTDTPTIAPPTNTPTLPPPPTDTPTSATPTPTNTQPTATQGPPTATPTSTPTAFPPTNTPTFTPTAVPPTITFTPTPTFTQPTSTPPPPTATPFPSVIFWDADEYFGTNAHGVITVEDPDLGSDPFVQETATVRVWSQTTDPYPGGLTVTLYEESPESFRFRSVYPHIGFGPASRPQDNILGVSDGETVYVRYIDATGGHERIDSAVWRSRTLMVEFSMPAEIFSEGDMFRCDLNFTNGGETVQVDLYVLLDVFGQYFCYPGWQSIDDGLTKERTFIPGGEQGTIGIMPDFTVPPISPIGPLYFYGCMFSPGKLSIEAMMSNLAMVEFYFN